VPDREKERPLEWDLGPSPPLPASTRLDQRNYLHPDSAVAQEAEHLEEECLQLGRRDWELESLKWSWLSSSVRRN
jgi:hypothetical protein